MEVETSSSIEIHNEVWLEFEKEVIDNNEEVLKRSLVGRWGALFHPPPDLVSLKSWAQPIWRLKGNFHLALLGGPLIFFEFEDAGEAKWVLHIGVKWFRGKGLFLDWWNPSVGCLIEDKEFCEVWVRILGLPLHLWGNS